MIVPLSGGTWSVGVRQAFRLVWHESMSALVGR